MNISFEIVPRTLEAFEKQYEFVENLSYGINMINVPDIQHLGIRSWELARRVNPAKYRFIPHFRAIDFKIESGELYRTIEDYELENILLVTGDPPEGLNRTYCNTNVIDLIRAVRRRFPKLNIYAGFDPHRQGLQSEFNYILRKADAGVDGFFSQPFYDYRLIEIFAEHMEGLDTYIGISPVVSLASQNYWEVKNHVKFPKDFTPDYDWNVEFANSTISLASKLDLNIYFMPIRVDLNKYLGRINFFNHAGSKNGE